MSLFTQSKLRSIQREQADILNKSLGSIRLSNNYTQFDVFLSHSFLDKEVIKGIFTVLSEQDLKVYVDWIVDPQLNRNSITKETAEIVRKRMKQSSSLIYATSENANNSKWMLWETGFMDGYTKKKCAILPVSSRYEQDFKGREFLSLYPYIDENLSVIRQATSRISSQRINSVYDWSKY